MKVNLFSPANRGNVLQRGLAQTKMIATGNREGGFFIMIGKKDTNSASAATAH